MSKFLIVGDLTRFNSPNLCEVVRVGKNGEIELLDTITGELIKTTQEQKDFFNKIARQNV